MSVYQMGQYRFSGVSNCLSKIELTPTTWTSNLGNNIGEFTDYAVIPQNGDKFLKGHDYHIKANFPGDSRFDICVNLKLMSNIEGNQGLYQWVDFSEVLRNANSKPSELVVLFKPPIDGVDEVKAAVPLNYYEADSNQQMVEAYRLYRYVDLDGNVDYRYSVVLNNGESLMKKVAEFTDVFIAKHWEDSFDADYEPSPVFDISFRPIEDFTHLVFEIERTADDWNMANTEGVYGRSIDPEDVEIECYEIKNLLPNMTNDDSTPISHIGVWGRPGLLLSVNGEPIRIGPRGYYEQDSLPITSIGVVATSAADMFTIDYKYQY